MSLTLEQITAQSKPAAPAGSLTLEQIEAGGAPAPAPKKEPGIFSQIGSALISSETGFGKSIVSALPSSVTGLDTLREGQRRKADSDAAFMKAMNEKKKRGEKLSTNMQRLYDEISKAGPSTVEKDFVAENLPGINKTNLQVVGEGAGVALDIATAGVFSNAVKGFKLLRTAKTVSEAAKPTLGSAIVKNIMADAPTTAQRLASIGKNYLKSAAKFGAIGYGYDVTGKLQEGKDIGEAAVPGLGTAIAPVIPLPGAIKKTVGVVAKETAPKIVNSLIKPLLKDFSYGKNPGRAVAEEGIVGNSLDDLAKNIGTRRQEVGEKIGTINAKFDAGGKARVDLSGVLSPLDEAMKKAAASNNQGLVTRLQAVKDSLTHELVLGTAEDGAQVITKGKPRQFYNTKFANAFDMKRLVGDGTRWTGNASDDKDVNGALKRVYGAIKERIGKAAAKADPEAAQELGKLNEKYADLTSAEIATKYRDKIDQRQNLVSLKVGAAGGTTAVVAAITTGGAAIPVILAGLSGAALEAAFSHPAVKSRVAAWLAKESPSVLEKFITKNPKIANILNYTFATDIR
ncbi:MAG: hypothetical protein AAB964_00385, partial [Patescibacteria group bacterium]